MKLLLRDWTDIIFYLFSLFVSNNKQLLCTKNFYKMISHTHVKQFIHYIYPDLNIT